MRYLDTGSRDPRQTLGHWALTVMTDEVEELRWQTGFFSADGLGFFAPVIERLRRENKLVIALVGANGGETLRWDVEQLARLIGVPRGNAILGIISFDGGYYHPKTYHVRRSDGSQAAYVGSANLTAAGVARHVEAGLVLDTREGDPARALDDIAAGTDSWVGSDVPGFTAVEGQAAIDQLVADQVLSTVRPPRVALRPRRGAEAAPRPRLRRMLSAPIWSPSARPVLIRGGEAAALTWLATHGTFYVRTNLQRGNQMQFLQSLSVHVTEFSGHEFEFVQEDEPRRRLRMARPAGGGDSPNTLKLEMAGGAYRAAGPAFVEIRWNRHTHRWDVWSYQVGEVRAGDIQEILTANSAVPPRSHQQLRDPASIIDWLRRPRTVHTVPGDAHASSDWLYLPDDDEARM